MYIKRILPVNSSYDPIKFRKQEEGSNDGGVCHFTFSFKEVSFWQLHAKGFFKLLYHADSPEGWGEVNLIGLALWAFRVIGDLVSTCNMLHHA